jgi:hypothetical protein
MPHLLVTAKAHDRDRSLGWLAVAWIEHYLVYGRGDVIGQPVKLTDEMATFIVDCYALDENGRRLYDSVFLSRPKGCDKSGVASYIAMFEAFGPCRGTGEFAVGGEVFDDPTPGTDGRPFRYEYEPGDPIGRKVVSPFLRCLATEEGQVGNVYDSIYFNLTEGSLSSVMARATDAGLTRVFLPNTGEIRPSTSSSASKDGGLETWVDFDETHLYTTPELRRTYAVVKRNLRKRKKIAETWYLETTTMYAPGEESVAESTYKVGELIREGKLKRDRLLLDHRWGEIDPDDLGDETKLRAALTDAYGEALLWNDLDGLVNEVYDPESDISDSIRYFLNDRYSPGSSWLNESDIRGVTDEEKRVQPGEAITIGLDGSRGRARGKPDATALIGCRISDGHLFEIGVWEAPDVQAQWKDWEPPLVEIEAALLQAFNTYDVVGFYADPAKDWRSHVNAWEAKWGPKVRLKAGANHAFEWWMTGGRATQVERAVESLEGAIRKRDITISGEFRLVQHLRNARRRLSNGKLALGKENDYSPHKIDAAVAAVLAYQARLDALAKGFGTQPGAVLIRAR